MNAAPQVIYEFGPFRIDPDRETLLRDGESLPITPKAFEVLLVLVRRSHEVVAKDELMQAVWPGRVVEEANLSQCIFLLRKLLGDTPDARRYIVTLPGKGYRFAAPVRALTPGEPDANATSPPEPPGIDAAVAGQSAEPRKRSTARKLVFAVIGVLIVAVVVLASGYFVKRGAPTRTAAGIPAKSIAVLPFENLSNDKNNAYFVAGMQDLILTKLADIGDLKVIARTSTMRYGSRPDNLTTIGQQLGVATILEGSVQKAGNEVLINVQLIDARTDNHIWAQSYQRTLTNVFGVEGEVAQNVATALKAKLSPVESARLASDMSTNDAANNLFLQAEYEANQGQINYDTANWKAAIPLYRQAVEQDPDFALAWARLSYNESELAWFGGGGEDVKQLNSQARADAERALQLQPKLSAAHLAMGYFIYHGRGDYDAALQAFAEALKLKPNDADALAASGFVERRQGRFDKAIASFRQALTLDPRNSALATGLGEAYMQISRYADAENAFQRALAIDPNNRSAKVYNSHVILFSTGDIPRALAAAEGDDPLLKLQRVDLLTDQGKYIDALALLGGIPDTPDNFLPGEKAEQQADLYWRMGDKARARPLYEQALPRLRAQLAMQQGIDQVGVWQGIADADLRLGHTEEGLDAIAKAQAIVNKIPDQTYGPMDMQGNAALYAEAGRPDLAVPLLAKALASSGIGYGYSPVMLWLDPAWDPIRHDPRFQALLKKYAKYKPAVIPKKGDGGN